MRARNFSIALTAVLAIFVLILLGASTRAAAQQEKVLHNFGNGADGIQPYAGLIFDAAGDLFGTTLAGGANGYGTVFELMPNPGGSWTEKILHNFNNNGTDGLYPRAGLVFDVAGNLYGATGDGGAYGSGTIFELLPTVGGGWAEKILHNFGNGEDGQNPDFGLIFDGSGNLYGTTGGGGAYNYGTVFELKPTAGGNWAERVLHNFYRNSTDGSEPSGLVFDVSGNLYGVTFYGGAYDGGTLFQLMPTAGGTWTEKILHNFSNNGIDGFNPFTTGLIFDAFGNLYGTTTGGGAYDGGTVFELKATTGGGWTEKILHNFNNSLATDGNQPEGGLVFDTAGKLYGTTVGGGTYGYGVAFKLALTAGRGWTEKILHNFSNSGTDGGFPYASLIFDASSNLYSTTSTGGAYGYGTVFEIRH